MASRLNSDNILCGTISSLPEEGSSEKESGSFLVFARKTIDPAEVETLSNFLTCPPFGTHERESFFRFGSAHAASAEDNEP